MRTIETWVDISASAMRIWAVLIAFDEYPSWNPFITTIAGALREGATLRVQIKPPGQSGMTFKPTLIAVMPERQLTWLGHLLLPGLFDGRHELRIEERGATCRFHQSEQFSGVLVPVFGAKLLTATQLGFVAMNRALKERVENAPAGPAL
jgi:hypothetical protein